MIPKITVTSKSEFIDAYTKRLRQQGIKIISKGLYSTVYQHPTHPNVVVKLFEPRFGSNYLAYVNLCCSQFKGNPWVPKFYGRPTIKTVSDAKGNPRKIAFVFTEKLRPATPEDTKKLIDTVTGVGQKSSPGLRSVNSIFQEWVKTYRWTPHASSGSSVLVDKVWWTLISKVAASSFDDTFRKLRPIAEFFSESSHLDVDTANIMMRGDQWVFTDPVYEAQL